MRRSAEQPQNESQDNRRAHNGGGEKKQQNEAVKSGQSGTAAMIHREKTSFGQWSTVGGHRVIPILGNARNVRGQNEFHAAAGLDRDRRQPVQVMAENLFAARRGLLRDALSKSVPGGIGTGGIADLGEAGDRADNGG